MAIKCLLLLIILAAYFQENKDDKAASIIFCIPAVLVEVAEPIISGSGWYYYLLVSICDISAIYVLTAYTKSNLSILLSKSLLASVSLNIIGFNLWFFWFQPDLYYNSFIIFYLCILYILLTEGSPKWLKSYRGSQRFWASLRCFFVRGKG